MKPKISVLDYRIPKEIQEKIKPLSANQVEFYVDRCPASEQVARTADADVVMLTPWERVDAAYLDACPSLKYVNLCGTSTANIDLDELARRGIHFTNMKTGLLDINAKSAGGKQAVAEFFFMQLVRLARGEGRYQWKPGKVLQLKSRSVGIIGLGEVGQGIARMALAYNMDVSYYSPNRKSEWEDQGIHYKEKSDLLKEAEIVFLCSPTNVEVMGETEFGLLQDGSILVQACGGSPFDKNAFYDWVSHEGNFAIFDMSANEQNYALYKNLPRVIFSKLVAGDTYESDLARAKRALFHLEDYIEKYCF